jgi:hypothetical protein
MPEEDRWCGLLYCAQDRGAARGGVLRQRHGVELPYHEVWHHVVQARQGRLLQAAGPAEPRRHGARHPVVRHAPRPGAGCQAVDRDGSRALRTQAAISTNWGSGHGSPGASVALFFPGAQASAAACGRSQLDAVPTGRYPPSASSTASGGNGDGLKEARHPYSC